MSEWIALVVAGLLTWAAKAAPSVVGDRWAVPPTLERASTFAAPALLGALTARALAAQAAGGGGWPVLLAAAVALPAAVRSRSVAVTTVAGVLVFSAATALAG